MKCLDCLLAKETCTHVVPTLEQRVQAWRSSLSMQDVQALNALVRKAKEDTRMERKDLEKHQRSAAGIIGAKARNKALSPARRREIARKAIAARWGSK